MSSVKPCTDRGWMTWKPLPLGWPSVRVDGDDGIGSGVVADRGPLGDARPPSVVVRSGEHDPRAQCFEHVASD
ncbi:hypothetical protein BH23ACT5_BH23ACT5_10130 [soil metagenome]